MLKLVLGTLAALLLPPPERGPVGRGSDAAPAKLTLDFLELDSDGDGRISRDEFLAEFERLDRNRDGFITSKELSPRAAPKKLLKNR